MKPEELRIGNITDKGTVKSFYETGIHVGFGDTYEFNECSPVPLTEECLKRMGFKKQRGQDNYTIPATNGSVFMARWSEMANEIHSIGVIHPQIDNDLSNFVWNIKYVHQLQNLFYALTGSELEIKD